ncbi:multicopper oxidase family protein [Antrihabitans cavernicola]|uniref:multicopper oxidase family protein n=1 Tax=Antrihabitans cavernicola TaxID=2495913 RepID=UPI001F283823|nr:multicopper oxidase domain-containing protein [Spelaeibacter cavernicola]
MAVAVAAGSVVAGCASDSGPVGTGTAARRPLPVPPLLAPRLVDGKKIFALDARAGISEIKAGISTPTWGYNGSILGPTVRARRGDLVRMEVTNSLPEMTTTHWHGMHLPALMDGGPHQPIEPSSTWTPEWRIDQQAATLWYHPHPHGNTGHHIYRGLAGLFVLDDDNADAAGLPNEYGVDDIPLIIQDRRFHPDGTLDETDRKDLGLLGDTTMVNGITDPHFIATARRVRFRILNGATMRMFNLRFSDGRTFHIVASDSGLLNDPTPVENVYLSPGERAEIVLDLKTGDEVTLRAVKFADNLEVDNSDAPDFGLADEFDLLTLTGPNQGGEPAPLPNGLNATLIAMPDTKGAPTRNMDMEWFQINGKRMDITRVDDVIDHQGWEVWTVANKDNWLHNFHVHDTQFRVLSLERTSTTPMIDGWKDTILLAPGAVATLAVRFTGYTSTRWPYMYHCHMAYHEDQGMMGQFVVVEPGQQPDPQIGTGLDHQMLEYTETKPSTTPPTTEPDAEHSGSSHSGHGGS